MRLSGVLFASLFCALSLAGSVSASPPVIQGHSEFTDSLDIPCGAFKLHEDLRVHTRSTTFFDRQGLPARVVVHFRLEGTITGPGGRTARILTRSTDSTIDLAGTPGDGENDTTWHRGLVALITVPGRGSVVQDMGLVVRQPDGTLIFRGPHDVFESGLAPLICPLFA